MGRREAEAPIPPGPLREFARGLRELRAQVPGAPTYRELARRARCSVSALADAASGRRVPSWAVTRAFVAACGGDVDQWRERWIELNTQLRVSDPALLSPADAEDGIDAERPARESGGNSTEIARGPDGEAAEPAVTDLVAAAAPLTPSDPRFVGPFRLLGRLGGGSIGRVYLAASKDGQPVAVTVLHTDLAQDPLLRRRFATEVAALRRGRVPFTAAVLDADTDAEQPWLATVYLSSHSPQQALLKVGDRRRHRFIAESLRELRAQPRWQGDLAEDDSLADIYRQSFWSRRRPRFRPHDDPLPSISSFMAPEAARPRPIPPVIAEDYEDDGDLPAPIDLAELSDEAFAPRALARMNSALELLFRTLGPPPQGAALVESTEPGDGGTNA